MGTRANRPTRRLAIERTFDPNSCQYGLAGWLRGWALGADSSVYRAGAVLLRHDHSLGVDSTGPDRAVFLAAGYVARCRMGTLGRRAGALTAFIAVFASIYSASISEQRHRTINSFLFFMLSNPYVLTAIAIALALGAAGVLPAKREKFRQSEFPAAREFQ